jgi:Tol biopolymer transport system component
MGEVYRARDTRLAREVAIKVLPSEVSGDASRSKRFGREAQTASALNHPNIVTIYDIGSEGSVSWIAMERIDGRTLRELFLRGPLPVKQMLAIAAQIADGLARAHEAGIVHRDLKPENVMVTKDGRVKILDFGLAKQADAEARPQDVSEPPTRTGTSPGTVLGTAGYMSPEQAAGQPVDFRSDQFSFGSIFYEMAAGKRAFHGKTSVDTLAAILNRDPHPVGQVNPQVPAPVRWIVDRCLAKDPEARYGTTRDLARDIATLRDHLGDSSAIAALPASRRRFGFGWSLGAAAAAAAIALIAAGLLAGRFVWKAAPTPHPRFQQLTFREEEIQTARFAPDGQTIVYGAVREGQPFELFATRAGSRESRSLGLNADILSISAASEMAILLGGPAILGTLAQAPLAGGAPRELLENVRRADWSADGAALAVVRSVQGRERLEFPIGTVLFESAHFMGRPRFSRQGDRILFADGYALAVADLKARRVRTLKEPDHLSGYGWSPSGDEIWMSVVSGATSEVRAFRPGGPERVLVSLPGEFLLQDISRDGRVLVERRWGRAEMIVVGPGQSAERELSWLDGSVPADISPEGSTVLFTESGAGSEGVDVVYLRKTDGSDAVRLGEGFALALSPDGKWALARRGSETILIPTGAGQPRPIAAAGISFDRGGAFFPDGERLLLSGTATGVSRVYEFDLETGAARAVTPEGTVLDEGVHTVTPDGRSVVARDRENGWSIYLLGPAAPSRVPVEGLEGGDAPIRWAIDGRRLFVLARNGSVFRLDPATGRRELYRETRPEAVVHPTPDGSACVYGHGRDFSHLLLIEGLE